jgi:hypothetical protein
MPRNPSIASEDPKVQERREKARAAYARKKAMTSTQVSQVVSQLSPEKAAKAKAKATLTNAIKNKIARKVLETKKEQKKFRSEGENDLSVYAELPRDEIYLYASQYPRVVNFLKNKINKNNSHILFTYKPYYDYDSFVYTYRSADGKLNTYTFKINNDADIDYSSYLYDTFYEPVFEKHNKKAKPLDKLPLKLPIGIPPPPLQYSNDVLVTNREREEDKTPKSSSGSGSRSSMPSSSSSSSSRSSMPSSSSSSSSMPSSSSSRSIGNVIFNKYKYSLAS